MGPSTRKRKDPPPNCTLLDFFSPDAIKRARSRASQSWTHGVPLARGASRDIIVVDSDSDEGVLEKEHGLDPGMIMEASERPCSPNSARSEYSFGAPSALLRSPSPRVQTSSDGLYMHQQHSVSPEADNVGSSFGTSAPLLQQTSPCWVLSLARDDLNVSCAGCKLSERDQTDPVSHESVSTMGDSVDDPPVGFPIGEWAAGDDEHIPLEVLHDAAVGEDQLLDEQLFCPVCGMDMTGIIVLEAQSHVNHCLDTSALQNDKKCSPTAVPIKTNLTPEDGGSNMVIKAQEDLYTVLMNSCKENEVWEEVDPTVGRDFRPGRGVRRKAPFYKVLQGMPIAVDAFCYGTIPGVTAYFLTHAHSDHYTNLGSKWNSGPIYCSEETASLILHMLAVDPRWIHPLPLDTPTIIPNTGGVSVTLIEANHCPGSCLFFFEGQQTIDVGDGSFRSPHIGSSRVFHYLHCGDFRASPRHVFHPSVNGKYIDHIYLDTTYLNPKYIFPPQPLVISACADLARRLVTGEAGDSNARTTQNLTIATWAKSSTFIERRGRQMLQERTLVVVGTYSIGKERIVKAIARALGTKIYCDTRKAAILRCQADNELHALLTSDPTEANVHILPLGSVTSDNLRSYLQRFKETFSRVIGFRPTGWTYSPPSGTDISGSIQSIISRAQSRNFSYTDLQLSQKSSYSIQIYGVPYSEHSSFFELTCFAMSCDWGRMIPTVNVGDPTSRAKMTKWLKRWESEKRRAETSIISPRTSDYW